MTRAIRLKFAAALAKLADHMGELGVILHKAGQLEKHAAMDLHGAELIGASRLVRNWSGALRRPPRRTASGGPRIRRARSSAAARIRSVRSARSGGSTRGRRA